MLSGNVCFLIGFILNMSISNLDHGMFKAIGWFANFAVFLRVSLIPLWQSLSSERVIHQVIYFQRMAEEDH